MTDRMPGRTAALLRAAGFMVLSVLVIVGAWMAARPLPSGGPIRQFVVGILATAGVLIVTYVFATVEKTSVSTSGVGFNRTTVVRFGTGFAIGIALVTLTIVLSILAFGPLSASRNQLVTWPITVVYLLSYIGLAAMEELAFRGYPLFHLRRAYGVWSAQIIVALAFALYHMTQGWPLLAALLGTTAGSILFGAAALRSGGLALPIGIHAAWNFGTWALGEKAAIGVWVIARRPGDDNPLVGTVIYLGVMLGAAWLIGWVGRSRVPTG
jgi:membrane protease YdiL (CAAX protease family)